MERCEAVAETRVLGLRCLHNSPISDCAIPPGAHITVEVLFSAGSLVTPYPSFWAIP